MVERNKGNNTLKAPLRQDTNVSIMSQSYAVGNPLKMDKAWFIQSRVGNIKDHYFFEKKLGSGGYGAVYLAKNKTSGTQLFLTNLGQRVAVKAMQKGKITDYESFRNEITILMQLVQHEKANYFRITPI
jgi:serine/threonine protein kinase